MEQNIAITAGILVRVTAHYRSDVSQVSENSFFFNYRVEIENQNHFPVQLIHRDWFIFDSLNHPEHVSGEGVVGEFPLLEPGETYHYTSGCELHSEIGSMFGFYTFKNAASNAVFSVNIPSFQLIFPGKLN